MKLVISSLVFCAVLAHAQGTLPWSQATSIPALAANSGVKLFYVSSYTQNGPEMPYDLARQAADAYVMANPTVPTYVVLNPSGNATCEDVPLPSAPNGSGNTATVSIIGYGSGLSSIVKHPLCPSATATLNHPSSSSGITTGAVYQGFTVDANHLDQAACEMSGMTNTTFLDVACGDAVPGADHEIAFGGSPAATGNAVTNVTIYNLKAFDAVGAGKGAVLAPTWNNGMLSGITVISGGTKEYTGQFTRAQFAGPGLASCSTVPTITPTVSQVGSVTYSNMSAVTYGYITGATITNAGNCTNTNQLYILIQDGVPVMYGAKFANLSGSHLWNVETTSSATYGEAWLQNSANNSITGEHPYTNQTIQIADYSSGNKHISAFFDGPGAYGAALYGRTGSFTHSIFSWDSSAYVASSGYYLGSTSGYSNWTIQNSQCTDSSANFITITTTQGPLAATQAAPAGVNLIDVEACDGSNSLTYAQVTALQ